MARRWVWAMAALSLALTFVDTLLVASRVSLVSEESIGIHGWPLVNLASVGCSAMGALIVSTLRRHPIGWLLALVGLTTSVSLACESYSERAVDLGHGDSAIVHASSYTAALLGGPLALAALAIMFLLLPDGRVLSPRWRWPVVGSIVGYALFFVGQLSLPASALVGRGDPNAAGDTTSLVLTIGVLMVTVALVLGVAALIVRFLRSDAETRQQIQLVAFAGAAVVVALLILLVGQAINGGEQRAVTSVPLSAAYVALLMSVALAVLRYRMYDLDVVVSRAVLLTAATLFAVVGYIVVVVAVGGALGSRDGSFWRSLLATVVVALAFQPLRSRIVRFADRLAYGERAAPYEALAELSRELGARPDPSTLMPAVAEAVGRAARADFVIARIDFEDAPPHRGWWPWSDQPPDPSSKSRLVAVPVGDDAGALGAITLAFSDPAAYGPEQAQLVADLADQAALAFRNVRLELVLADQVAALDLQAEQLQASRRRLIGAADLGRQRLERSISREVLPTLSTVKDDISRASASEVVDADEVQRLIDETTRALVALRELTRGIFPTVLTRSGLTQALTAHVNRLHPGTEVRAGSVSGQRFDPRVEAAAYFCSVEALRASAEPRAVELSADAGALRIVLDVLPCDDLDDEAMRDRLDACGGALQAVDGGGREVIALTLPIQERVLASPR